MATVLPRRADGQLLKGAGDLVHCGRAALAMTEAGGGALWVGPALQGPALVLIGVVQSQEQYVALLSHLLPIRLR